jgi:hypothetical protein
VHAYPYSVCRIGYPKLLRALFACMRLLGAVAAGVSIVLLILSYGRPTSVYDTRRCRAKSPVNELAPCNCSGRSSEWEAMTRSWLVSVMNDTMAAVNTTKYLYRGSTVVTLPQIADAEETCVFTEELVGHLRSHANDDRNRNVSVGNIEELCLHRASGGEQWTKTFLFCRLSHVVGC